MAGARINSGNYTVAEKQILFEQMADRINPRAADKKGSIANGRGTDQGAVRRELEEGIGRGERLS